MDQDFVDFFVTCLLIYLILSAVVASLKRRRQSKLELSARLEAGTPDEVEVAVGFKQVICKCGLVPAPWHKRCERCSELLHFE